MQANKFVIIVFTLILPKKIESILGTFTNSISFQDFLATFSSYKMFKPLSWFINIYRYIDINVLAWWELDVHTYTKLCLSVLLKTSLLVYASFQYKYKIKIIHDGQQIAAFQ